MRITGESQDAGKKGVVRFGSPGPTARTVTGVSGSRRLERRPPHPACLTDA